MSVKFAEIVPGFFEISRKRRKGRCPHRPEGTIEFARDFRKIGLYRRGVRCKIRRSSGRLVGGDAHIAPRAPSNSPGTSAKTQCILPGRCGHRPLRVGWKMIGMWSAFGGVAADRELQQRLVCACRKIADGDAGEVRRGVFACFHRGAEAG
mgnify:CR=1 FL=1